MTADRLDLPQGTLELLVLKTLVPGPRHGWGISERIRQVSREALEVRQGSLYPALHRLERRGWRHRPVSSHRTQHGPDPHDDGALADDQPEHIAALSAFVAARATASVLFFGIDATDAPAWGGAIVVSIAVGVAAHVVPAMRAVGVAPSVAPRSE